MSEIANPTARTRVVREPHRGIYDRETVYQILDEGLVCHVGFVSDGQPFVIPMNYGRSGDHLYLHGSVASRMLRRLDEGVPVCLTVTLLDGLVFARAIFNHSMNYRSVVVLGTATRVEDVKEKLEGLRAISEHIAPGRWKDARPTNETELKATLVLRLPIQEFSGKARKGPPMDDEKDLAFPAWAGVLPLALQASEPIHDPHLNPPRAVPEYVKNYSRSR